jgi:hypothetical protein
MVGAAMRELNVSHREARCMSLYEFTMRMNGVNERRKDRRLNIGLLASLVLARHSKKPLDPYRLVGIKKEETKHDAQRIAKDVQRAKQIFSNRVNNND